MSYGLTFRMDLNWKERLYITISGFPKATVQASGFIFIVFVIFDDGDSKNNELSDLRQCNLSINTKRREKKRKRILKFDFIHLL